MTLQKVIKNHRAFPTSKNHSDSYAEVYHQANQMCANIIRDSIPITVIADKWSEYI